MGAGLGCGGVHGVLSPVQLGLPEAPLQAVRRVHVRRVFPHGGQRQGCI